MSHATPPPPPVDLTNCESEPIRTPGAIQPHGALVAYRPADGRVTHASANVAAVLGVSPGELLGADVRSAFAAGAAVEATLAGLTEPRPVYLFAVPVRGPAGRATDAIGHRVGDLAVLEFEPAAERREVTAPELYRLVQQSIVRLQVPGSLADLCDTAARQVRAVGGFDRVMVYRFDHEWNGRVVAEDRRPDLEPFLGLNYPASDIPRQARELYTANWLRFIPDRDYAPAAVLAGPLAPPGPLDLSHAVLRSVSPIHVEYLRNMGVRASMSVSLIRDGRLWGLIACHHYAGPRFVPYDVRTACELLGQYMSSHLGAAEDREAAAGRARAGRVCDGLLDSAGRLEDVPAALAEGAPHMLDLVAADGAAVVADGVVARVGQVPGEDEVRALADWVGRSAPAGGVYATDHLQSAYGTGVLGNVAAGLMAVSIDAARTYRLLWFRTERVRTVDWAGDPAKTVTKGDGPVRLSPRGSFALWKETVRGRSDPWTATDVEAARCLRDGLGRLFLRRAAELARTHADLRLAGEEREKALDAERAARAESDRVNRMKDDFVATLSHELRTPLNAILGWSQILARQQGLAPTVAEGIDVIGRNARSQVQMIDDLLDVSRIVSGKLRLDLQHTHLPSVVDAAVETVALAAAAKGVRVEKLIDPLIGVDITADPNRLQQVVWNLLSNAVKFTPRGGKVQVVLERVDSHVELAVTDTGQGIPPEFLPHVFDRFRQADASAARKHGGLGLGLAIVRNLVELHGGTIRAHSPGAGRGSSFVVTLPVRVVHRPGQPPPVHPAGRSAPLDCESLNLAGVRVLVVDDEPDARGLVERILTDCACVVVAAASAAEALAVLESSAFDAVVSDVGMPGGDGLSMIRAWRAREAELGRAKTPAVALTAYVRADDRQRSILAGFQSHLGKPVEAGELLAVVASLAGRV